MIKYMGILLAILGVCLMLLGIFLKADADGMDFVGNYQFQDYDCSEAEWAEVVPFVTTESGILKVAVTNLEGGNENWFQWSEVQVSVRADYGYPVATKHAGWQGTDQGFVVLTFEVEPGDYMITGCSYYTPFALTVVE